MKQNQTGNLNEILNSYIQIQSAKISPQLTIPYQVCLCLNDRALAEIEQTTTSQTKLVLSPRNLANLRHYALLHLPLKSAARLASKQQQANQSSLTFSSQYSYLTEEPNPTTLLRSVIDLKGEISQQVQQQLIDDPVLLARLSQAHYWLINEILTQLPFQTPAWHQWLIPVFWAIVTVATSVLTSYFLPASYLIKIVVCLLFFCLSKVIYSAIISKWLKSWVMGQLTEGFLTQGIIKRQLGLKFLSLLL